MLKLYFAPKTCALASLIALEEAGLDYTVERVDMAVQAQRSPDYLAINPKGRIPALATDRGILTETPAILAYIAHQAPGMRLAPIEDAFEFARLQAFNSYLCSTVHVAHAHNRRGSRWADDPAAIAAMTAKVPQNMAETFALIVREYFLGPWVMGEAYSIADAYLFTIGLWLEGDGVDPIRFPKILAHRQRMSERPAVARAMAVENS
ncbi:glutathione S-transferase family protein [Pararhizobium sp.]|uniref:glutathione S-transferase family protein n=1 Tax=Pararhizobium sp. TaxID=1977563 RepID=UPI00272913D3|nr:glutathione S-transferase N-terminal domain-containing protein [Pararhizobium sp.]MDO9417208.1 glutathione S-transferase N-terminal domain-containing protein [Pararhizobium sp.]